MQFLIAILSCVKHAVGGQNQVMRDTWLKNVENYKFFMGDGTPVIGDNYAIESWHNSDWLYYKRLYEDTDIRTYVLREDEVALRIPDSYSHASFKLREACRWALENGYDYIFQCLTDTYVVPERLLESGFEKFDYLGTANDERTALGGGPGFWLSKRAMQFLINAPVTKWNYDEWTGDVMEANGIKLSHDERYTNLDRDDPPRKSNRVITSHIANCPAVYDTQQMISLHSVYEGGL
jgi:hypothetical protein